MIDRALLPDRDRAIAIGAAVLIHLLLAAIVLRGGTAHDERRETAALTLFTVAPPPPPPPVVETARSLAASGKAAPAASRADPKPVAAPPPIVPPPATDPAPPIAAEGPALSAGAAPTPGPGTGAGGVGDGRGRGGSDSGTGGGGSPARLIRGAILDRDYPREARRAKLGGTVTVRFTVQTDGRTSSCTVMQSSGVASLDAVTCALVEKRFRYAPARDADGAPVAEERGWRQRWWLDDARAP